ncbi:nicotinate-nucleotide adenylyltransferase [Romboutsia maritimum]|uniref:Probable nicotinate-nucleotide adenylyltransferase n=1 Tax=Romboutsia maritimum TaxID=2020948 RepID=A0A371IU76_9FIRM|nr:nicotinate-nucleotide adenylyltransferase [Romboutsia maritimum]RDY24023.1 nicotinate-nucleotide adenylyltransferase [Romboutsia maritimum]
MRINDLVNDCKVENTSKLEQFKKNNKTTRIGIMGGTFNPIHYAHLATAEFIRDKYGLDKILFIPSGNPPHKPEDITNKYDRYNMVLLATVNNKDFLVLDLEVNRNVRTYTVDTLRQLKKIYKNIEIYFITGADAICDIEQWKDVQENFKLATFIAATRPGISVLKAQEKIEQLIKKYNAKILSVYVPSLDISSTYIRNQLRENKSVRYLVPESVEKYIYENKLYDMEMSR